MSDDGSDVLMYLLVGEAHHGLFILTDRVKMVTTTNQNIVIY